MSFDDDDAPENLQEMQARINALVGSLDIASFGIVILESIDEE